VIRALFLSAAGMMVWLSAGCELGDGDCLRMSDCDLGYVCVEGTCRSNAPADAPNAAPDSGARSTTRAEAGPDAVPADASSPDGGDAESPDTTDRDASDAGDASTDADASAEP